MRRVLLLLLFLVPASRASEETLQTFEACWSLARKHFYDSALHGVDWEAVREKYRPLADTAAPGAEFHGVLRRMLGELKASHTAILDGDVYLGLIAELHNDRYWTFGVLLEESRPGERYVRALYEGGPGARAGLLVGDRIVGLDERHLVDAGYDRTPGAKRLWSLRANRQEWLKLTLQRTPDPASRRRVTLVARLMNGVDAARASVRVVRHGTHRIGTLHLWYCSRSFTGVLRKAVAGPLKECDALVVDLRGRGGFPGTAWTLREIQRTWKRPMVFLIDERTRSAKEVLAHRIRKQALGWLVGRRTEGAVLAAGFYRLPDASYVELPVSDVVIDGVRLEGRGVAPDFVADLVVPYAAGRDGIFDKGLDIAAREIAKGRGWRLVRR